MTIYFEEFSSEADLISNFRINPANLGNATILFAYYGYRDYMGDAYVLFRRSNKLYEVHGTHCSCHGLEHQWEPEHVTLKDLRYRLKNGKLFGYHGWNKAAEAALTAIVKGGIKKAEGT